MKKIVFPVLAGLVFGLSGFAATGVAAAAALAAWPAYRL